MRKICVLELFSAKRVQSFQFLRDEEVASLVVSISKSASSATPLNLSEKFMSLTANITFRAAFGRSSQEREFGLERFQEVIREGMAMLGCFSAADFFPYVGWIVDRLRGLHGRRERIIQELDSVYQRVIDDRIEKRRKETGQEDITDLLLVLERSQPESGAGGFQFSRDHIKAILMNYEILPFSAGGRSCPGMAMGLALVDLALANLLFCFDWKLPYNIEEDINMAEAPGIVTGKKAALFLSPIKYLNA
ncbi:hypothetical protein GH714_008431 [Hevea brasiliensis]|uniref:Cytochrome P450 n=1 Tax=Hevea brasiliensis TaxID=3981 RepID=A0A6A6NC36_HEVBR|nr:hypothetical protein GH714_008431 [Hevea brasiliensis]